MRWMQKIAFLVSKLWTCPLPPQPCASWTPLWYNYMHTHGIAPLCFKYHSNKTPCTIFTKTYIQYLPSIIFQSLFICDCKTNNSFNGNWKFSQSILAQFFFDVFIVSFLNLKHMKESKKYIFLLLIWKYMLLAFDRRILHLSRTTLSGSNRQYQLKNHYTHGIAPPTE